jgi:hypothetical protein
VKAFLRNPKNALMRRLRNRKNALMRRSIRSKKHDFRQARTEIKSKRREEYRRLKNEISKIENELESIKQQTKQIETELRTAEDPAEISEHEARKERIQQERSRLIAERRATKKEARTANIGLKRSKKRAQQEIFVAERGLGDSASRTREGEPGVLPDFVIIGGRKCGTTYLYHLLGQHPLVQPAASKELHFFDVHFDLGVEWYRRCFPAPRWEDGRRTITGEGTPYLSHPLAPERMAQVVPGARLIALLRNPVERAYSDYQQVVRKGRETRTFEEAIVQEKRRSPGEEGDAPKRKAHADLGDARHGYLSRSTYVDQLLRWSEFFSREQMLVLKSEDLFEDPHQTLKIVLGFLGLPEWETEAPEILREQKARDKRNAGGYEGEMDPSPRRRLEEYFAPHNRRLYDYLGRDFGW